MPRKVFDIFLSSTSADLDTYRAKVGEMISRMRQTSIRMETFGAQPTEPLDTCRAAVQRCDALIVIVGHRYGWTPSKKAGGDGVRSITWWEVQWALDAEKPVYAFLVDQRAPWVGAREQDRLTDATTKKAVLEIGYSVQNLQKFRAFLDANTTRELFTSADDLAGKVATSLHDWLLEQPIKNAREAYPPGGHQLTPTRSHVRADDSTGARPDSLYWQEQVHLISARYAVRGAQRVRVGLIAGRADTNHPVLAGAHVRQFDARFDSEVSQPDDFTTGLAGLLVDADLANQPCGMSAPELLILQVLNRAAGTSAANVLAALDAAVREGVEVLCIPLGMSWHSDLEGKAYDYVAELGVVTVCPAGNYGNAEPVYPAAYPGCLAAGVVDQFGHLARFSNYGDWVTTAVPGVDIVTAIGTDGFAKSSGAAYACAILTHTVALMLGANRQLKPKDLKAILRRVGPPVLDTNQGTVAGDLRLLDAYQAVCEAGAANGASASP